MNTITVVRFVVGVVAFIGIFQVNAQTLFEEVDVGISYQGQSWGSAWGDFNGDGWYDLWTTNHGAIPSLYLNQTDGTFVNIALQVIPEDVLEYYLTATGSYDAHGAGWFDVDRDGDVDLFQGGDGNNRNQPNQLLINNGGVNFTGDVAVQAGVDAPMVSTRRPVGMDWNHDGFVDIFTYSAEVPTVMSPFTFFESNHDGANLSYVDKTVDFNAMSNNALLVGMLTDFDQDDALEFTVGPVPNFVGVLEFDELPPNDITSELGLLGAANYLVDAAVADYDGDLDLDIYAVRGENPRDLVQTADNVVEASVYSRSIVEEGLSFKTTGDVTVAIYPYYQFSLSSIYVGAGGYEPDAQIISQGAFITLSSDNSDNHGVFPHTPGVSYGHYIGYDPVSETWQVLVSADSSARARNIVVSSTAEITDAAAIGFTPGSNAGFDHYYRNDAGMFTSAAFQAGLNQSSSARSVAAGDFDNDGDIDLYVVATGSVENRPNILYLNDGAGAFSQSNSHGAEGSLAGRGDSVSMADYDNDGFLDLFVSNGKDKPPFYFDGPYHLFRNLGNDNHWLQIELVGTVSEIQGLGAKITVSTLNGSQFRLHGNSNNGRSQHMVRSHFGLADQSVVNEVYVSWPSGHQQKLQAVQADQIITITEPVTQIDTDGDSLVDSIDNCLQVSNALQTDTDLDGFGNACDADYNNDCAVNFLDFAMLSKAFLGSEELFDSNDDGVVNFLDIDRFAQAFLQLPGPSGTRQDCEAPVAPD